MDIGIYDLGDGGGAATKWQRQHAARKRAAQAKKHRAEAAANKKRAAAEAKADFKKRYAKWHKAWKRKCAEAKAAGRKKPGKMGRPWRRTLDNPQVVDMVGRVFGHLTVIRSAPLSYTMRTAQSCRCWVVKCSCGSPERVLNGTYLRQGLKTCCGCTKAERMAAKRKLKPAPPPLSVKLLIAARELREAGNTRIARLLELAAPTVRRKERRKTKRVRRRRPTMH